MLSAWRIAREAQSVERKIDELLRGWQNETLSGSDLANELRGLHPRVGGIASNVEDLSRKLRDLADS